MCNYEFEEFNSNKKSMKTLYGLKKDSKIKIYYNIENKCIDRFEGIEDENPQIVISEHIVFSMPMCITINNIPFFPSKYEFINDGEIIYASQTIPRERIKIIDDNFLNERAKVKQNTITLKELIANNKKRKRSPSQNKVMGESARNHAEALLKEGKLSIENKEPISWHWCHLVAFSMLPTDKSQKKNNLVCGTAACNGHMANIEAAIKRFIYEFKRPLGLEVTATIYMNSHIAKRIRYRIYDKKGSRMSHSEYFDALTDNKSDTADYEAIYNRMLNTFEETTHNNA